MVITIISILMLMLGFFLMLYGAVGFIQDKRLFSSAPKENLAVIPDKKERFKGAQIVHFIVYIPACAAQAAGLWAAVFIKFMERKYENSNLWSGGHRQPVCRSVF